MPSVFAVLCFHLFLSSVGALFGYAEMTCRFNGTDRHSAVYKFDVIINKVLVLEYDGTSGKCVGFTKVGKIAAEILNKNKHLMKHYKKIADICKYVPELFKTIMQTVEPTAWIHSVENEGGKHPASLVCSVNNFYPKEITVTWLRNGENVTSGEMNTDVLANGNWLYQTHSYLEYTPKAGETITCVVDHASLVQPMLKNWEPLTEPEKMKIAVGSVGILMGLGVFLAGLIYYIKKPGRTLVPSTSS